MSESNLEITNEMLMNDPIIKKCKEYGCAMSWMQAVDATLEEVNPKAYRKLEATGKLEEAIERISLAAILKERETTLLLEARNPNFDRPMDSIAREMTFPILPRLCWDK